MSLCLLASCSSFASSHLTHNQTNEYRLRLAQVKDDISEIKKEIVDLKNDILTQQLTNTEIVPLRNQLNAYEKIIDRGYEPYPNWIFGKNVSLRAGLDNLTFYTQAKTKAYERITDNYVALITYINTKTPNANVSIQGDHSFSVNGETVLDY